MAEGNGTVELAVRLVVGADPVRGSAQLPNGEHSDFWGWLELAEIVQTATQAHGGSTRAGGAAAA